MAVPTALIPLDRLARGILAGTAFAFFYFGGWLLSWVILPVARSGFDTPAKRSARCRVVVSKAYVLFHDYMRTLRLVLYNPRDLADVLPGDAVVIVSNHPTLVDVTAVMAAQPAITCLAKSSYFRSLVLGRQLRYCWHIPSSPKNATSGAGVVLESLRRLEAGLPVLIFPEGTRSPVGGLRRFKRGAFEIACRAQTTVQPLYIRMEPPMLSKAAPWYTAPKVPATLCIQALPPIDPAEFAYDSRAMAHSTEAGYKRLIAGQELGPWTTDVAPLSSRDGLSAVETG